MREGLVILTALLTGAAFLVGCSEDQKLDPAAVERGERIASVCVTCHSLTEKMNKIGPHLVSVLGRKAGTVSDYEYSEAMKQYGQEWTTDRVAAFLQGPLTVVPGTKMGISPLSADQARDVVSYLQSLE